jgi:anthranilate phosphoribosyltransferase
VAVTIQDAIARTVAGQGFSADEMCALMERLMDGEGTPAQIASWLTALRMRGESVDELVGAARAMRARMLRVPVAGAVVDNCGTGGDGGATFNISTAAALVAAAAGARIAKHGNRASSSRVGGADVLEALGVAIDLPPAGVVHCLEQAGIGFCFAPRFHAAMRFAAVPRREIGIRTLLNLLGPLANPAGAERQLVGVFAPEWTEPMAHALARLGSRRALVVHGADGLDEVSASGPTRVSEVADGTVHTYHLRPEDFGMRALGAGVPRVADAAASAAIVHDVLAGRPGAARDVVLVNAAAVLVAADVASDWRDGVRRASRAVDEGAASTVLTRLITASRAAAGRAAV